MKKTSTRESADQNLQTMIDEHGWAVVGVFPTTKDDGAPFSYTVGLTDKGLPELAVYGLDPVNGGSILNAVAQRMIDNGELHGGERLDGLLDGGLPLAVIDMGDTSDLSAVRRFYGAVLAARQIVWPDRQGRMPWESWDCPDEAQPLNNWPPF
ncbi:MAG: DUF4262 domain-containing protein [Mycobacterium sp.]